MSAAEARARGFTILEALVAAALAVLVFGLVLAFLVPTMNASAAGAVKTEMQQQAALAAGRLATDLERSAGAGLGILPWDASLRDRPVAVGITTLEGYTPDGHQVWSEHAVVYYWDRASRKLLRRTFPPSPRRG